MVSLDEEIRQARVRCRLPPESKILFVPLIGDEAETWLEFKKLDEGNPINSRAPNFEKAKKNLDLEHPIVPLVGIFAFDAFNELCMLFVKKNVSENLHSVEIVEAQYVSLERVYIFLITLEAVEEDVVGVYDARVICYRESGMMSLIKLMRSLRQPAGKKAETSADFIGLKSKYQDVQAEMKMIKAAWKHEAMKVRMGKQRAKEKAKFTLKLINLKKKYNAKQGVGRMLYRQINQLKPPSWETAWDIGKTDQSDWSRPTKDTWLIVRPPQHHACRGYDYYSRFPGFDLYMHMLSRFGGESSGWNKPF